MRQLLTGVLIFIAVQKISGQEERIAYYDAIYLKKYCDTNSTKKFRAIPANSDLFNYYFPNLNSRQLDSAIKANLFLKDFYQAGGTQGPANFGNPVGFLSKLGGLDVTNIANGVAQFMIKRAKEELTVAFFNRFKKFSDQHTEFRVLFPKTADNLQNLLAYKYPEMLPALRTGFFDDLKNITYHLDDVLELPHYHELLKNFPEIRVAIRSIRIIHEIESGDSHPADVLKKFGEFPEWTDTISSKGFRNFGSSVKLAAVFSNSLRKEEEITQQTDTIVSNDTIRTKDTFYTKKTTMIKSLDGSFEKIIVLDIKQYHKIFGTGRNERDSIINDTTIAMSEKGEIIDQQLAETKKAWISFKEMKELIEDDTTFKIYLGLIYQLVKKNEIKFYLKNEIKPFTTLMVEQKDNLFLFQNKVTEFIELANNVDEKLDTLKEKRSHSIALTNDDYYDYIDVSLDVIEYAFSIGKLFNEDIEVEKYTTIARKSNDLYRNIYKKEYTQALTNGIDILSGIHDMINESKNELVTRLNSKFSQQLGQASFLSLKKGVSSDNIDLSDTAKIRLLLSTGSLSKNDTILVNKVIALVYSKDRFSKLTDILEKITRYGLFMANIVNAETPEEISSVLENAALPVGSSSIKKNSAFNISVQSYLGAYRRFGSFNETNSTWSNEWGVIAPLGVSFSHGFKKGGAISLFGSLFDIGAIVDYQLKKDPDVTTSNPTDSVVNKDYEVKLGQIFSPGGYLVYGFPFNIPLSLGIGGQYGPGLGKVEAETTIVNNPQWRWSVFLAVDIPFFNLTNSPKRYKP